MKIIPTQGPSASSSPENAPKMTFNTGASSNATRDKVISILTGNKEAPVPNANAVSAEELGALKTQESSNSQEDQERTDTIRESSAPQADSESPAAVEETSPAKSEEPISSQYAILAKREKALRAKVQAQEAAIKAKEQALLSQQEALKAKELEIQSKYISKDRFSNDTLNALAEAGLSYEQITELMLNQASPEKAAESSELRALKAEIEELKNFQKKSIESREEEQKSAYNQAVAQIKNEVSNLVLSDPEFEVVRATNSIDDVVELIEETFKQDGILLSVEEAAKAVEEHLLEESLKIAKIKKIQSKLNPVQKSAPVAPKKTEEARQIPTQPSMKTLTHSISSTRQLTAKERAILAFKGELKK